MTNFEICVCVLLPSIIMWHFVGLFVTSNSRYQKWKFRNDLDCVVVRLMTAEDEGLRYPTIDFTYKNRNFQVGIYKKEHSYYYWTYEIFINGAEAGVYHRIGDCLTNQYYFETQNKREQYEVMEIINACAKKTTKEINKQTKEVAEKINSWNEYSYFK